MKVSRFKWIPLLLTDVDDYSTIMGHHGHPLLPHRTLKPFVTHMARTA